MFSERLISPVVIRSSERPGSLGGYLAEKLSTVEFIFNESESIFGGNKYKFFYISNELDSEFSIYKIRIEQYIDINSHLDKFDLRFLGNISSEIVITNFFGKNQVHKAYTDFGEIIDFDNRNIENFIVFSGTKAEIKETLSYQDFYPFAIRVKILGPIERVIKLPIVLKIKTYLV